MKSTKSLLVSLQEKYITPKAYCKCGNFRVGLFSRFCLLRENYPNAKILPIILCLYEENRSSIVKIPPTLNVLTTFWRNFPPAKITTITVITRNNRLSYFSFRFVSFRFFFVSFSFVSLFISLFSFSFFLFVFPFFSLQVPSVILKVKTYWEWLENLN